MSGYREAFGAIEHTLAVSLRARAAVGAGEEALARVRDRRIARIAGGLTGVLGAFMWPAMYFLNPTDIRLDDHAPVTYWLWGTVAATFAAWGAARLALARIARPVGALAPRPPATVQSEADARAMNPWPAIARALWSLETWSLALPLVACSLLGPLFLHSLVWAVLGTMADKADVASGFAVWITFAAVIVPHAHLALAVHAVRFARRLARTSTDALSKTELRKAWQNGLGLAVLCAAIPGIVLFAVPPVITAVTALVLVPAMYRAAWNAHHAERAIVEGMDASVVNTRVDVTEVEAAREVLYRVDASPEPVPVTAELLVEGELNEAARRGAS